MRENRILKGKWWLPEIPDMQVGGTLTIHCDGNITLETIGELHSNQILDILRSGSELKYNVILGIDTNGKHISAFGFANGVTKNTSSTFALVKYSVKVIVIGAHIKSIYELGDYDIEVHVPELSLWFKPNCFDVSCDIGKAFTLKASNENTNNVSVTIEEDCDLKIDSEYCYSLSNYGLAVNIEQNSVLRFCLGHQISLQEAKKKVFQFEQFLSFATLSPVYCSEFILIDKQAKWRKENNYKIEVVYQQQPREINTRFGEYLFVHKTIEKSFDKVIKGWFSETELYPIKTHLIDSISNKGYFEANDFLIVCQAIEGFYCRFRCDGKSLSHILKKLIEEFSDIKIQEISEDDIRYIQDTRNHFSHLLPIGKKGHVLDGHELYNLNHKLRKLLICCVLKLIGFTNYEINHIFTCSQNSYLRMIDGEKGNYNDEPIELDTTKTSNTLLNKTEVE